MNAGGALFAVLLAASVAQDALAQASAETGSAAPDAALEAVPAQADAPGSPGSGELQGEAAGPGPDAPAAEVPAEGAPPASEASAASPPANAGTASADAPVVVEPTPVVETMAPKVGAEERAAGSASGAAPVDGAGVAPATEGAAAGPSALAGSQGDGAPASDAIGDVTPEPQPVAPAPGEQVLYERLLGQQDPALPASGTEGTQGLALGVEAPTVPGWLWVVGILGGAALLLLRSRSLKALRGPAAIGVLSRSHLGKDGSLAIVEVAEADGEKRRLLVGFGGGAPRLVADLGRPFPEAEEAGLAELAGRAAQTGPRAAAGDGGRKPAGSEPSRGNAASAWARAVREAGPGEVPPQAAGNGRLERRHDLIQEVLAERGDDDPRGVVG